MSVMTPRAATIALAALLLAATSAPTLAQQNNRYQLQPLNFYLWCQDTARLPASQCDQRLPADVERFETYRTTIERYEIPYLQERENRIQMNRTILHADPAGNPVSKNPLAQSQTPIQPSTQRGP